MPLTEEQDERLTTLLQGLEPETKNLNPSSQKFVQDQIARHAQYGDRVFMSPKQWAWLEDLYQKHVGGVAPQDTPRAEEDDQDDTMFDLDDKVPF